MKKKILAVGLAAVMTLGTAAPAFAATDSATYSWDMVSHEVQVKNADGTDAGVGIVVYHNSEEDNTIENIYEIAEDYTDGYWLKVTPSEETIDAADDTDEKNPDASYDEKAPIWNDISELNYADDMSLNFLYDLMTASEDTDALLKVLDPDTELAIAEDYKAVALFDLTPSANLLKFFAENEGATVNVPIENIDGLEVGDQLVILQVEYNQDYNFEDLENTLAEGIDQLDLDCTVNTIEEYEITEDEVEGENVTTLSFDVSSFGEIIIYKLVTE